MINLKQLLFDKDLSQRDLAEIIGEYQSVISLLMSGKRKLMARHIEALEKHFGKDVIKSYTLPDAPFAGIQGEATVTVFDAETMAEIKGEVREELESEMIKKTIVLKPDVIRNPQLNIKAALKAGELEPYAKPTQDTLPTHTAKIYAYCDDMEPEIHVGEPALVQLLPNDIDITPGQMYFIDLPEGGIFRYIEKEFDGKLYLKARNSNYGDLVIPRDKVQSIYWVRLILHVPRSMSNKESTLAEMMVRKDAHLSDMLATNNKLIDELCKRNERTDKMMDELLKK